MKQLKLTFAAVAVAILSQVQAQTSVSVALTDMLRFRLPEPLLGKERGEAGEYEKAFSDFYMRRIDKNGKADWKSYGLASTQAKSAGPMSSLPFLKLGGGPSVIGNWAEIGPTKLDVPYQQYYGPARPTTGRVTATAWDPNDIKTYYVASAGGGVWKTTNDGTSWTPLSDNATWPHLQVGAMAVDPKDGNKVYAGLGDSRGGLRFYSAGIMESVDAGQSWTLNATTANNPATRMAIDPSKGTVLVTTGRAVYYDLFTGTWKAGAGNVYIKQPGGNYAVPAGLPADTVWLGCSIGAKDRNLKRTYYVAGIKLIGGGGSLQVWAGKDGVGWANLNVPNAPIAALGAGSGIDISASPANPNNVYVVSGNSQKVYRYDVAANTWNDITAASFPSDINAGDAYNWSQAWYDIHIMCSYVPGGNRDVLYCGLITLAATDDQGTSWTDVGMTYQAAPNCHNDQHCASYFPADPNWILFGNDGGVFAVKYDKDLKQWGNVDYLINNPNVAQFYHGDVGAEDSEKAIGGTQDNASPRAYGAASPNDALAANINRWNNAGGGDGGWTAVDPTNSTTSYTAVTGTLWQSTDGWTTAATGSTATVFPLLPPYWPDGAMGAQITYDTASFVGAGSLFPNGQTLYYASQKYLFRYINGAAQDANFSRFDSSAAAIAGNDGRLRYRLGPDAVLYQNSGRDFTRTVAGFITTVVAAPNDPDTVYVGTSDGYIWVSRNATNTTVTNVTWTRIDANLPLRPISEIVVNPFDSEKVWAVLGGTGNTKDYVWACADTRTLFGPVSWTNLDSAGLFPVCHNTIALDPKSPTTTYYCGTDCGVNATSDSGASWTSITTPRGLPNVQVSKLVPSGATSKLTAFTFGRGAWQIGMDGASIRGFGYGPATLKGGGKTTLRVVLWKPAPAGGTAVALAGGHPLLCPLPANLNVAPGSIEATAVITTGAVLSNTVISTTATVGTEVRTTSVTLTP